MDDGLLESHLLVRWIVPNPEPSYLCGSDSSIDSSTPFGSAINAVVANKSRTEERHSP